MQRCCVVIMTAALMLATGLPGWTAEVKASVRFEPTRYENMYELYAQNKERNRPTLVTSDSVLHSAHVLFDYTLRAAELQQFNATVRRLTALLLTSLEPGVTGAREGDARLKDGTLRVTAYCGVAQRLLDPAAKVPEAVRPLVEREVALILAAHDQTTSPVMGVIEDYTQYKPRGHYTRNETFQRYFRAMMWYGRAGFPISGEKAPGTPLTTEEIRDNAWAGILLSRTLATARVPETEMKGAPSGLDLWQRLYRPTEFIIGQSDDLTPREYQELSLKVFGATLPTAWSTDVQVKIDTFVTQAKALRPPKIVGTVQTDREKAPPVSLRLFGQRFTPDSNVFQRLVHPSVPERTMPTGLDVMAVLGSRQAQALLAKRADTQRPEYAQQLATLQREWAGFREQEWEATAYRMWLRTLKECFSDPRMTDTASGQTYPAWWQSPSWQTKQLNTALGSWAELRHDTILYVKQSYTVGVTAFMPPEGEQVVYVEPAAGVYNRLARLMMTLRGTLTAQGVFPKEMGPNYQAFLDLLTSLSIISLNETISRTTPADGTPKAASAADWGRVRDIGAILQQVETLPEPLRSQLTGTEDTKMALIADVHTDPNTQSVLEVGVGRVAAVVAQVPGGDGQVEATGPVFTYYEFTRPWNQRMTDAEWQAQLMQGTQGDPFILPLK